MATSVQQDDWHKTALRLPKALHATIHDAAAKNGRSFNAELVARLEASFMLEHELAATRDALYELMARGREATELVAAREEIYRQMATLREEMTRMKKMLKLD